MSDIISTFKRYEKKYMMDRQTYNRLRRHLDAYLVPDRYPTYTICNIYYDTDRYSIIRRSIEKPIYKEKLRLRSYGVPAADDPVFFELKKKYDSEVFKRRVTMTREEFEDYQNSDRQPEQQILREIEYFRELHQPHPAVFIAYERTAFSAADDPALRITFDTDIRYRETELDLSKGDYGRLLLDRDKVLMEVKVSGAMPLWLTRILSELKIYPTSFSKYGYCYENYLSQNRPAALYGRQPLTIPAS